MTATQNDAPGGTEGVESNQTGQDLTLPTSVPRPAHNMTQTPANSGPPIHRWLADASGTALDRLALVAVVETPAGRYRRRVFLSLDAAHKALDRAAERGLDAHVLLCELVPVRGEGK